MMFHLWKVSQIEKATGKATNTLKVDEVRRHQRVGQEAVASSRVFGAKDDVDRRCRVTNSLFRAIFLPNSTQASYSWLITSSTSMISGSCATPALRWACSAKGHHPRVLTKVASEGWIGQEIGAAWKLVATR